MSDLPGPVRGLAGRALTPLVGRARELELAQDLLRRGRARLLTLRGPGGIGKTRLAHELIWALAPEYDLGGVFVELADIHDSAAVVPAIALTLGVRPGPAGATDAISDYVNGRTLLVVLDNAEHLLGCGPELSRLLQRSAGLAMIVTSRRALHVTGEHELPVGPLAWTGRSDGQGDAETLFLERVRAVDPQWRPDAHSRVIVRRVCELLEGVPLSLELAAARLRALSLAELLTWLEHPLEALADGARDQPERLRSLRGTLEWSFLLLDEADRELFLACGLFSGSFSLEALQAVTMRGDVRRGVTSLVEQSLIYRLNHAPGRYAMLQPLRELAAEKFDQGATRDIWRGRQATYFTELAVSIDQAQEATGWFLKPPFLAQVRLEYANLIGALSWWVERQETQQALQLATALSRYWYSHGSCSEGCFWLQRVVAMPRADLDPHLLIRALDWLGILASAHGEHIQAQQALQTAIELQRHLEDQSFMPVLTNDLGFVLIELERFAEAEEMFLELAQSQKETNLLLAGIATHALAQVMLATSRPDEALAFARQATALHQASGNWRGLMLARGWKSAAHRALGELHEAWHEAGEALELGGRLRLEGVRMAHLRLFAGWLADDHHGPLAVQFMAASVALRDRHNTAWSVREQQDLDLFRQTWRASLGETAFDHAWQAGTAASPDQLLQALRMLSTTMLAAAHPSALQSVDERVALLTPRELEVLRHLQRGAPDKRIAQALQISAGTVSKHVASMLGKLGLHNRVELAQWANEHQTHPPRR